MLVHGLVCFFFDTFVCTCHASFKVIYKNDQGLKGDYILLL